MPSIIRIATRNSRLALWQAHYVRAALQSAFPDRDVELVEIASTGDLIRDRPLHALGAVGIFTKQIQEAVLNKAADVAVHSLKDLPTESHPDLVLAAVPTRANPADIMVLAPQSPFRTFEDLPAKATIATSSMRRRALLLRYRPDLQVVDIRGNVETRLAKLESGELAGTILAAAGLERLALQPENSQLLDKVRFPPAVGQGALGIECRKEDDAVRTLLRSLEDPRTRAAVEAERAFLRALQGGCQTPIAAHAAVDNQTLNLHGIVLSTDGAHWREGSSSGRIEDADTLGRELATELLSQGAGQLLHRR